MVSLRKRILYIVLFVLVLVLAGGFFNLIRKHGVSDSVISFDDGWSITFKGANYQVAEASKFEIPFKVQTGDTLVLENQIPETLPDHPELRFRTTHSAVQVDVDETVYSFGPENLNKNDFVGSGINYVALPPGSAGKHVRIQLIIMDSDSFSAMPHFSLLSAQNAISDYNATHLVEMVIGLFLVMFGIIAVLSCILGGLWGRPIFRLMQIGFLSFLLGIWTLCYMKLMQSFSMDFAFNAGLELITLYLSPIPFGLLLWHMNLKTEKKWILTVLKLFVVCGAIFVVTASLLHMFDVVHLNQILLAFHIYVFIGFLFVIIHVLSYKKTDNISNKLLTLGVAIFGVVCFADMLRYNLYKFFSLRNDWFEVTWIPVGILIFVILLCASYLHHLKEIIAAKAEKDALAAMVYVDSLTGLFNRAKCSQVFEVLDKSKDDYAIVSIDMNGLKVSNDKFGHSAGDKLIKTFARVFRQAFDGVGTTIRMGGDEFVAIIRNEHLADLEGALEKMEQLQVTNSKGLPVRLEAAYGVAYRNECPDASAEKVYQLADQKMYDMKMSMKSELVRR